MSDRVIAAFPFSDASRDAEKAATERKLAELMIASVRRTMPDVEIWQITDLNRTKDLSVDRVFRKAFIYDDWVPWMFDCLCADSGESAVSRLGHHRSARSEASFQHRGRCDADITRPKDD
jgi:hypothetical protein